MHKSVMITTKCLLVGGILAAIPRHQDNDQILLPIIGDFKRRV